MEEFVGSLWDKLITRAAYRGFPEARVDLGQIERIAPVFFRAIGGDAGLTLRAGSATSHGAQRSWMERVAGIGDKVELAWRDDATLYLPAARATLAALPGLAPRYRRLVDALFALRPTPDSLAGAERAAEAAIRAALDAPGSVEVFAPGRRLPAPVPLWLHPEPPVNPAKPRQAGSTASPQPAGKRASSDREGRKRRAERVDMPEANNPFMLLFRAESRSEERRVGKEC